jgi:CheY-like chemotaxis protein
VRLPAAECPALPAPMPAPLPVPDRVDTPIPSVPPPPGRPATALYIEDNPVNALLMEIMLEDVPELRLLLASRPDEGLEIARRESLDLVLLDIQMPEMDGFEVLKHLRADPRTGALPIIAVSANARPDDIARAHAAGFSAYLTKPVDLDLLLHTVRAALAGAAGA